MKALEGGTEGWKCTDKGILALGAAVAVVRLGLGLGFSTGVFDPPGLGLGLGFGPPEQGAVALTLH